MRRHSKASSARSNARNPVGHEGSRFSGRLRFAILLATAAAFLLVPVAQAAADSGGGGPMKVNIVGSGSGEVTSYSAGEEFKTGMPLLECTYTAPGPQVGICENEMDVASPTEDSESLVAVPASGSEFGSWEITKGVDFYGREFGEFCNDPSYKAEGEALYGGPYCVVVNGTDAGAEVTIAFCLEGESLAECTAEEPVGPELTVTKEGSSGTVASNPAGIECGGTCKASFTENSKVTLTASPAANSKFLSWKGCEKGGAIGHTCTVTMDKAKTVIAKFGPTQSLTLSKAGTGTGTVKSAPSGISCDGSCSSNVAAFTEGAPVTLTAVPTKYHTFTGWSGSGCSGAGTCEVTMSAAKSVTATFAATKFNLTLSKAGGGTGAVKSKPASLTCGATCSSVVSSFYAGTEVEVTATPSKGSTLNWATGSGTCTGSTSPCFVTMSAAKSLTAEFK